MADSSKFADFTEKAKQKIEQIKIGLLKHDKNPQDREFLNDISKSVRSIKNAAIPVGLPRTVELCSSLESLIDLIKEEKKELHQEIIITIAACRDRLSKLFFELETVQIERAKTKDLVAIINSHIADYSNVETDEIEPALSGADSIEEQTVVPAEEELSLLPEEIVNKEYDKELFEIFIEQLQENISLLRTLTDSFTSAPSKDNVITQCSNLVGKLQSSANYMDYQQLAEFYLQWVAELEMTGIELSMGSPVSFDFMGLKIQKIVNLFAEIEDKPADPAKLTKTAKTSTQPPSVSRPEDNEESSDADDLQQMFSFMDDGDDEELDDDREPIAALAGVTSFDEEESETADDTRKSSRKKKESRGKKVIEIDGSFLEEEKESENYDKELFQIFVQQLQENISQLQQLTDNFLCEPNKSKITDKCSNLVGKLQASANYMGYERLAEFYLQWIAELEMIGVELAIGSDISFDFMQEKINRIRGLFPETEIAVVALPNQAKAKKAPATEPTAAVSSPSAEKMKTAVEDKPEAQVFDDLEEEEQIEEPLAEGIEPIAGVFDNEDTTKYNEEPGNEAVRTKGGDFSEAVDLKLESFFANIEEPDENEDLETSFMAIASLSDEDDEISDAISTEEIRSPSGGATNLFNNEESLTEGFELIAGISDDQESDSLKTVATLFEDKPTGDAEGDEFNDALNEKLESFFGNLNEPDLEKEIDTSFMEIASISDEDNKDPVALAGEELSQDGKIADLFEDHYEESKVEKSKSNEFRDAVDEKLENLFNDFDEPEEDKELENSFMAIASLSEEEPIEEPVAFTAEPPDTEGLEDLFDEEEGPLTGGIESIADLYDEEAIEPEETTIALFEKESKATAVKPEAREFAEAMDEKLDSFFSDSEEPEALTEGTETIFAVSPEEEPEEIASALFEEESKDSVEKLKGGEFAEAMDEQFDSFFSDSEEPESLTEETEPIFAVSPEEEPEEIASALFEEESKDAVEKLEDGEFAEAMDEQFDSFFTDIDEEEPAEVKFDNPITEDIDAFFETDNNAEQKKNADNIFEERVSEEEKIKDVVSVSEEEADVVWSEEMLSDEELLQEIEGPIVGEEITTDTASLLPEIKIDAETVSVLSDDNLTEDELFKKLEKAISADDDEISDIDDLAADEEIFDESEIAESALETAPERKELFQKLSSALHSLDDETGDSETVDEYEVQKPEPEFDNQLFDRLVSALETSSKQSYTTDVKPMDQVLEEILSSTPVKAPHTKPPGDYMPKKLAAAEIKQIIHMDTDKVDHLMNQVGELNASRSALKQLFAEMNDLHHHYLETDGFSKKELKPFKDLIFRLGDTSVSLNRLSSEIREGILKVRMVPIGLLFDRYHEFISNLTSGTNKKVEIEIIGEDTELEKIVIDEISEPLTHIISNVVEHGIESIDDRKRLGKDEVAKLKLEAYHENNEIVIEVTDDGRGIDLKKVKAKALEQGLFTSEELFNMSESDLKRLILNPEFSTVVDKGRKPEDRGEGLHIVQTNIEKLKGSIDIRSKDGLGTIIQVRVPLNLLVIKALKVKAGKEIMALPVNGIEEIIKVRSEVIREEDGKKVITIHDTTLPVFKLTDVFNIEHVESQNERIYIIIVQADNQSIGLIVDETFGLEEIVIKPLGEFLRKESGFAGATIISDGNISLVPDIAELIRIATNRQTVPEMSIA